MTESTKPYKQIYYEDISHLATLEFNETTRAIIDLVGESPKTVREVQVLLNVSYYTVNNYLNELHHKGCVSKSRFSHQKGKTWNVNYQGLVEYLLSTETGRLIANSLPNYVGPEIIPNTDDHLTHYPRLEHSLRLNVCGQNTTFSDLSVITVVSGESHYDTLFNAGMILLHHVWYRNYLYCERGWEKEKLPEPGPEVCRSLLLGITRQINEYAKVLEGLAAKDRIFQEERELKSWRVLGDNPLAFSRSLSRSVQELYSKGALTHEGLRFDYFAQLNSHMDTLNGIFKQQYDAYVTGKREE